MPRHPTRASTCVFRVHLAGFCAPGYGPSIWREVEVSADQSLAQLGEAIPPAFGFEDDYLRWSFFLSGKPWDRASEYARPPDPLVPTVSRRERGADGLRVDDAPAETVFLFLLRDDDDWSFEVKLVRTGEVEPGARYPRVVARVHKGRLVAVRQHRRLLDDPIELAYQATSVLPLLLSALPITDVIGSSFPGGLAEALVHLLSLLYECEEPVNADELAGHFWGLGMVAVWGKGDAEVTLAPLAELSARLTPREGVRL